MPIQEMDNVFPDIEEKINKIIFDLSTPGYINFENNINSFMYELLFTMLKNELEYMKMINKNIHNKEYWSMQIIHTSGNAIELCTMIIVMIGLKVQT
jgi:hypothetical protein